MTHDIPLTSRQLTTLQALTAGVQHAETLRANYLAGIVDGAEIGGQVRSIHIDADAKALRVEIAED